MGTLLNRRRYMGVGGGSYDENSYIQDGLVFQLDGINQGTTDTDKWVDLVGGCVFGNASSNTATIPFKVGNGWDMGGGSNARILLIDGTIPNGSTYTAEMCCYLRQAFGSGHNRLFSVRTGKGTEYIRFYSNANNFNPFQESYTYSLTNSQRFAMVEKCNTISCQIGKVIINKEEIPQNGTGTLSNTVSRICIGNSEGNYSGIYGIVHAIRIYNRQLSQQEMLFNQDIDIARFGT